MANRLVTTLYVGVTNNIFLRVAQHKQRIHPKSFTNQYNLTRLVYFEETDDISAAIWREKRLKRWNRQWKLDLIRSMNPALKDLAEHWYDERKR